ncbi:putative toxin-antitoxin system toxin component, PIN family [Thermoanaerobacterium thermosaccharolyticum]|uniref:putative toxin-antitoxin system toxin component, PIN family n=1 Tax=Thermoanaerobacterium thermosaccharolyticum TaxID=1517 RepID=UPI00177E157B|nr:putative toxin-antitoxin system toxin component, PIN family [Thermoanaerobacterium thermosaccharolyticum]MBE0069318.1 putative toxin-antitoxin system toxin component, PIN family [Thermoanaerobacterium thermosaccharolyticum]MBE0229099.1 putative toxin-antitoxin system toxin component, PIN family [Thermoanaerobacterium thermosaccharolyticum]
MANDENKIFIDSCVLITAICNEESNSAKLLYKCKQGDILGFISQIIIDECKNKLNDYPEYLRRFNELLPYLIVVEVTDDDIKKYDTIKDSNDRHVLAGAINCNADYLVTLDWKHFLSKTAKVRLKNYPIRRVFPEILVNPFNESRLPDISLNLFMGTFSIAIEPQWTSEMIKYAKRPFYILDFPGIFSIYYEPNKYRIKFNTEVYKRSYYRTFPMKIMNSDTFIIIITWDVNKGFTLMVNNHLIKINQRWDMIPLNSCLCIGSDRKGINQINSLIVYNGWQRVLSEKELWRVLEGDYVTLPEKPSSL